MCRPQGIIESALLRTSLLLICFSIGALGQSAPSTPDPHDARAFVQKMVETELAQQKADGTHWMYRQLKSEPGQPEQLREVIETTQGEIYRLVALDGKPVTPEQQQKDAARLQELITNPDLQQKKRKDAREDAEKATRMLKLLPKAFIYQYSGEKDGVVFYGFRPDPSFDPPTREARVFHSMEGQLWINKEQMRLVRLQGTLMEDVNFGWGILGHLDKGGHFVVEQEQVGPDHWAITNMDVEMNGRALIFKSLNIKEKELSSDFQRVSDNLTLAEGASMLKQTVLAQLERQRLNKSSGHSY